MAPLIKPREILGSALVQCLMAQFVLTRPPEERLYPACQLGYLELSLRQEPEPIYVLSFRELNNHHGHCLALLDPKELPKKMSALSATKNSRQANSPTPKN